MITLNEMLNKIGNQRELIGCTSLDAQVVKLEYKPSIPRKPVEYGTGFYVGFPATVEIVFTQQGNLYQISLMFVESEPTSRWQLLTTSEKESLEASELLAKHYNTTLYIEPIVVNELEEEMMEQAMYLASMAGVKK